VIDKLPALRDPAKYAGLYIFDFGDHVAVGYTAEEIEILLTEAKFSQGEVYKIYRAHPDGTLDLCRVNPDSWASLTGILFYFDSEKKVFEALDELESASRIKQPPGEIEAIVVTCEQNEDFPFALVLRYRSELDDAVAAWLIKIEYRAGENVEGGSSVITKVISSGKEIGRKNFTAGNFLRSRTRQEVLADVDKPVQR
jgi:hypothetical protein